MAKAYTVSDVARTVRLVATDRAGVRLEVLRSDRVPTHGGLLFMWNQTTHLDHLALAAQAGVPIVCVTVIGGHDRLPRGSPIIREGVLRIVFSEPIETTATVPGDLGPLQQQVIDTFEEYLRGG